MTPLFNLHLTRNIVICAAGSNQTGNLFALLKFLFNNEKWKEIFLSSLEEILPFQDFY
jgi:hypothetical protein